MEIYAGEKANDVCGSYLPQETLDAIEEFRVAIKGPLTTPIGEGFRSLNVALRQELDLFACVRPVQHFEGVPSPVKHPEWVDMVIFRENTEDVYAGFELKSGSEEAQKALRGYDTTLHPTGGPQPSDPEDVPGGRAAYPCAQTHPPRSAGSRRTAAQSVAGAVFGGTGWAAFADRSLIRALTFSRQGGQGFRDLKSSSRSCLWARSAQRGKGQAGIPTIDAMARSVSFSARAPSRFTASSAPTSGCSAARLMMATRSSLNNIP